MDSKSNEDSRIIVIGGGASGLMSAIIGARQGVPVLLFEKMNRLGRKLLITGKGRCNVTTSVESIEEIVQNMPGNGRFLYSALRAFDNNKCMQFFEDELGVPLKVERGNRVFPVSDKAGDIVDAMAKELKRLNATVYMNQRVKKIRLDQEGKVEGVIDEAGRFYPGRAVILATGGVTYPGTGSTGDGHKMAKELGIALTDLKPSLVPLICQESWILEVQGLALKNVSASLLDPSGKLLGSEFGEMLFTHFGVSGPMILSLSKKATDFWNHYGKLELNIHINLKPALTPEQLDLRLQRDFDKYTRKQFQNAVSELFPKSLIPVMLKLSGISPEKFVHQITKVERLAFRDLMQNLKLTITGHRSIEEAIVTSGGVSIKELNPKTMETKNIPGLYIVGELADVDGYTGGFNLQAAWSMGFAAGKHAGESVKTSVTS